MPKSALTYNSNILFINQMIDALALNKVKSEDIFDSLLKAIEDFNYDLDGVLACVEIKRNEWRKLDAQRKEQRGQEHHTTKSLAKAFAVKVSKKGTNAVKKYTLEFIPKPTKLQMDTVKTLWTLGKNGIRVFTKSLVDNTWKLIENYLNDKDKKSAKEVAQSDSDKQEAVPPQEDLLQNLSQPMSDTSDMPDDEDKEVFKDFVRSFLSQLEMHKVDKNIIVRSLVSCLTLNQCFGLDAVQQFSHELNSHDASADKKSISSFELAKQTAYHTCIPAIGKAAKEFVPKAAEWLSIPIVGPAAPWVGLVTDILFEMGVDQGELIIKYQYEKAQEQFNLALDDKMYCLLELKSLSSKPRLSLSSASAASASAGASDSTVLPPTDNQYSKKRKPKVEELSDNEPEYERDSKRPRKGK